MAPCAFASLSAGSAPASWGPLTPACEHLAAAAGVPASSPGRAGLRALPAQGRGTAESEKCPSVAAHVTQASNYRKHGRAGKTIATMWRKQKTRNKKAKHKKPPQKTKQQKTPNERTRVEVRDGMIPTWGTCKGLNLGQTTEGAGQSRGVAIATGQQCLDTGHSKVGEEVG